MEDLKKYITEITQKTELSKIGNQEKCNEHMIKLLSEMVQERSNYKRNFEIIDGLNDTYLQIFMYLNRNKDLLSIKNHVSIQPWSLDKGLLMIGNFGRGKTLILDAIYSRRDVFKITGRYATSFEVSQYFVQDLEKFNALTSGASCLFLDEIGDEPKETLNYGNSENTTYRAMKLFFDKIEKQKNKVKFFGTSNLGKDEIIKRYDERIWSRIVGNCNIIVFGMNIKDFRKS